MQQRLGSWLLGARAFPLLLMVFGIALAGCSKNQATAHAPVDRATASELSARARELADHGESHRAEQYYLAALEAGGTPEAIYPELISACVRGGRLGSAAVHVEARIRQEPQDLRLVRLAISLREALGHEREANELAEQLASSENRSDEEDLFLAGYFERARDFERALSFYYVYFERTEGAVRPAWVEGAIRRLELLSRRLDPLALQEATERSTP